MTWTASHEAALERAREAVSNPPAAPTPRRWCALCSSPIPEQRRADAIYCRRACTRTAVHRTWRQANPERWRAIREASHKRLDERRRGAAP